MLLKGYISQWKTRKEPEANVIDYWFCSRPQNAAFWGTKQAAEDDCALFNLHHIVIDSSEGGRFICHDFKTEERAPGEFVIYCMAPFTETSKTFESTGRTESSDEAAARELASKLKPSHRGKN